jgi:hypothetical protein
MRTEASIRTSRFNTSEVRDYFINDCCFGDDLARWIIDGLRSAGIETDAEPRQEDFGWYFEFTVAARAHCCILGYQPDEPEGVWHLWLERSRGMVASLLGRRAHGIDQAAVSAIDDVLSSAPEIRDLQWESAA